MTKKEQVLELITGYANGYITDEECTYQSDLLLNEISVIDGMVTDHETDTRVPKEEYLKND